MRINVSNIGGSEKISILTDFSVAKGPGEKKLSLTSDDEWEIKCLISGKAECHCLILLAKSNRELHRQRIKNQSLKDWIKVLEHELARLKNARKVAR